MRDVIIIIVSLILIFSLMSIPYFNRNLGYAPTGRVSLLDSVVDFFKQLFSKSKPKQEKAIQELVQEETTKCSEYNPKATEEYCTDLAYHDVALIKEDISLCEEISNEILKNHCLRSLR